MFPIPIVHFVDGPKRGERIEARARRVIAWVNYGKTWGWREACYDLQYHDVEDFFYYTFRGFMDDPRWQKNFPAPGLPGWIDVPVREKSPTPLRNPQEEER